MPLRPALVFQRAALLVCKQQVYPDRRPPGNTRCSCRVTGSRSRAERRQFGHPPARLHLGAQALLDPLHQRRRHRCAADQYPLERGQIAAFAFEMLDQTQPHRRHTDAQRNTFRPDQLGEMRALAVTAGQNELAANRRYRERQAPGIGVEHRHDRQHCVIGP